MKAERLLLAALLAAPGAACRWPGAPETTPADAHAHAPQAEPHTSLDAFADTYRDALAARGDPPCTWQHEQGLATCSDGRRHDLPGMWADVDGSADPAARARALLDLAAWTPPPRDFATAAPFLHLRATPQPSGLSRPVDPQQPTGPAWQLELGLPGGTVPVDADLQAAWGVDWPAMEAAARAHSDRVDPEPFWPLGPGLARARVSDGHDPARLLSGHLSALPFPVERALLVPGHTVIVGDAAHEAELVTLLEAWREEHGSAAPAWPLQRQDQGWVAWRP